VSLFCGNFLKLQNYFKKNYLKFKIVLSLNYLSKLVKVKQNSKIEKIQKLSFGNLKSPKIFNSRFDKSKKICLFEKI